MRRTATKGVAGAAAAVQSTFAILTPDLNAFKRGVESARDCRRSLAELAKWLELRRLPRLQQFQSRGSRVVESVSQRL